MRDKSIRSIIFFANVRGIQNPFLKREYVAQFLTQNSSEKAWFLLSHLVSKERILHDPDEAQRPVELGGWYSSRVNGLSTVAEDCLKPEVLPTEKDVKTALRAFLRRQQFLRYYHYEEGQEHKGIALDPLVREVQELADLSQLSGRDVMTVEDLRNKLRRQATQQKDWRTIQRRLDRISVEGILCAYTREEFSAYILRELPLVRIPDIFLRRELGDGVYIDRRWFDLARRPYAPYLRVANAAQVLTPCCLAPFYLDDSTPSFYYGDDADRLINRKLCLLCEQAQVHVEDLFKRGKWNFLPTIPMKGNSGDLLRTTWLSEETTLESYEERVAREVDLFLPVTVLPAPAEEEEEFECEPWEPDDPLWEPDDQDYDAMERDFFANEVLPTEDQAEEEYPEESLGISGAWLDPDLPGLAEEARIDLADLKGLTSLEVRGVVTDELRRINREDMSPFERQKAILLQIDDESTYCPIHQDNLYDYDEVWTETCPVCTAYGLQRQAEDKIFPGWFSEILQKLRPPEVECCGFFGGDSSSSDESSSG